MQNNAYNSLPRAQLTLCAYTLLYTTLGVVLHVQLTILGSRTCTVHVLNILPAKISRKQTERVEPNQIIKIYLSIITGNFSKPDF